jgi:hypothetical protein
VSEEVLNPVQQSEPQAAPRPDRPEWSSQSSDLIPGILDVFSSSFFSLPFSTLTYMLGCWCSRFLAEE